MSDMKDQLEVDIKRFLENIEKQNCSDRIESLRLLFDKYLHLNTCDYMMDYFDLQEIVGGAKDRFSRNSMPVYLGEKKRIVPQDYLSNMCVVESTISLLNKKGCLKKLPKCDKRENRF